ncbi:PIN domain-containing protein [Pantoea sp. Acro-805]|jgi:predicted nucleic acid-binding protein|uniref:PIN domain-containing protein n=1 Tax=Candidatus Pantoea formicae TaxID=2608355 RepID=A0ABX0R3R8_9GAMM|nr:PIN domain-containing protein [Pantoea formicae]MDF7650947.1 PIN domain-containing protein [Erwiniaceae bacterium L1_54_3]NIF02610.1 PIN domain-containing protein [Pantoea formicae]
MSSGYTVVFDACVLYPAPLRSFLMYLAAGGQFRARWSEDIHEEWIRNVLLNRTELNRAQLERVRALMDRHVPDALVTGYQSLIESIRGLPDEDDRHVVAAAIVAQAEGIVTFNLRDFPEEVLSVWNLRAIHPDSFITDLTELDITVVIDAARRQRASLLSPPFTPDEYLDCLLRQQLPETVSRLRPLAALI